MYCMKGDLFIFCSGSSAFSFFLGLAMWLEHINNTNKEEEQKSKKNVQVNTKGPKYFELERLRAACW